MSAEDMVWVRTSPTLDGTAYQVVIEAGPDHARGLTPAEALSYAREVMRVVAEATHDAAVGKMLVDTGIDLPDAVATLGELRASRRRLTAGTSPLILQGCATIEFKPFIAVSIEGEQEPSGQWTPDDARAHAASVIEAIHAARLDQALYEHLTTVIGIKPEAARAAVGSLAEQVDR